MEQRCRKRDVAQSQLRHQRALRELADGCADHRRERPHRVHQTLPERLRRRVGGIQMQCLRVHRQRREQHVVGLGRGATRAGGGTCARSANSSKYSPRWTMASPAPVRRRRSSGRSTSVTLLTLLRAPVRSRGAAPRSSPRRSRGSWSRGSDGRRVLVHEPVAAEDLRGVARVVHRRVARRELGDRGLLLEGLAGIPQPRGVVPRETGVVHPRRIRASMNWMPWRVDSTSPNTVRFLA